MRRILVLFVVVCCSVFSVKSQDSLYLTSGKVIICKVKTIAPKTVSYARHDIPDGPEYIIKRKEVRSIRYENGVIESFVDNPIAKSGNMTLTDFKRNQISFNYLDIVFKNVTIGYERILGENGNLGIKGSASIGFSNSFYTPDNNTIGGLVQLNYYPAGQRKYMYYVAPMFLFGQQRVRIYGQEYINGNYIYNPYESYKNYWGFYISQGFRVSFTNNFAVGFNLALGMRHDVDVQPSHVNAIPQANLIVKF